LASEKGPASAEPELIPICISFLGVLERSRSSGVAKDLARGISGYTRDPSPRWLERGASG